MGAFSLIQLIQSELEQDCFGDDVTSRLLGESGDETGKAVVFAKEPGVFSGTALISAFEEILKNQIRFSQLVQEGQALSKNQNLVELMGPKGLILSVERTLLNFLGMSCGVASFTQQFVAAVKPHPVTILATRKTTPGLRSIQLQAVKSGGGKTHRRSLSDGILIKENHAMLENELELLRRAALSRSPLHGIEIEVQNVETLHRILKSDFPPDVIMLDNLSPQEVSQCVKEIRKELPKCRIEASGGVNLDSVRALAETGVDYISVGRITHSAPNLNLSLDFQK